MVLRLDARGGGLRRFPTFGWSWHEPGGPQHRCFWNKGHQVAGKSHQPDRIEPYLCLGPLPARRAPSHRRGRVMRVRTGLDVLEYELRQEQAATIGRLARELRDSLNALDTFDSQVSNGQSLTDRSDPQRARLVDAAPYALWNFVVQRECCGFRWTEEVLKDYAVPGEVRARMGAVRPR